MEVTSPGALPQTYTISVNKTQSGLGVIIAGGINRPEGPHIRVDKILDGMDAQKVHQPHKIAMVDLIATNA